MSYERAFANTMKREGGYANDPKDPGGETYMGISRVKHPEWTGWPLVDSLQKDGTPLSLSAQLADFVRSFYRVEFWAKAKCDMIDIMSEQVAEELFDSCVNCGIGNGVKFLQRALNRLNSRGQLFRDIKEDGSVGTNTLQALAACLERRGPNILLKCQNGEQYRHYVDWGKHEDFPGVFERL